MGPCWITLLYAPDGLSCPWDVARFDHPAFKLGANIAAYVVAPEQLQGKLVEKRVEVRKLGPADAQPGRAAFTLGQVVHAGRWQPHKRAWGFVLERLAKQAAVDVFNRPLPLKVGQETPFKAQALYLTGAESLQLSDEAKEALKLYIERGGFIFAEAACSSPLFDKSLRALAAELFADHPLQEIPVGHALYDLGPALGEMVYSPAMKTARPTLDRPLLEHIEMAGRSVLVYSRYDLSSAIDGHPCIKCPSILEPSAGRLALKILLYALSS
jgi:hypothetical protein